MQHRRTLAAAFCAAVLLGACSDEQASSPVLPRGAAPSFSAATGGELQDVARILALGLARQDARVGVRNAMRRSPLVEHKLELQAWAHTSEGGRVIAAAAREAGVEPSALLRRIDALPAMDFYAPFRDHRRSWRADGSVVVAATIDPDVPEVTAFATDGSARRYRRADGVPAEPMLMLHPAEPKGPRQDPQADVPGDVIQDPNDGERSVLMAEPIICPPDAVDCGGYYPPVDPCDEDPSLPECQYTPPPPPSGTFMEGFWLTSDGDTEWGDEEFEFRSSLRHATPPGSSDTWYEEARRTLRYEGVNTGDSFARYWDKFDLLFSQRVTDSSRWIVISLYETDPSPNPDDQFGSVMWTAADFAAGNGLVNKAWTQPVACGYQQTCQSVRVSADLRVTPWP